MAEMPAAEARDPVAELIGAAGTILREAEARRRINKLVRSDRVAARLALRVMANVADAIEARVAGPVSADRVPDLHRLRRTLRRQELVYWQTEPEFLRTR